MVDTNSGTAQLAAAPPLRPEYLRDAVATAEIGVVQKPLTVMQGVA